MNRVIKKSYKVIFVLAILLASAFVSTPTKAANEGSITIRKFDVNRYENLKESTGVESDQNNLPADATKMADVEFKVERLEVWSADEHISTATPVDSKFTARIQRTNSDGETIFTNLPSGYYLVTETIPEGYDAPDEGKFVVVIPMQVSNGAGGITTKYDVVVYPKGQKVMVKKVLKSEKEVVGIGDIVNWTVDYPMFDGLKKVETDPSGNKTTKYGKNFFITDEMDTRLDYVEGSARMKYLDSSRAEVKLNLSQGVDYNISYDAKTHILTITFTDDVGTKKIADANIKTIVLDIATSVNESALETVIPMVNNARIVFKNASGDPFEHEAFPPGTNPDDSRVPKVYLGSIDIEKVDSENEAIKLADAEFSLAATAKEAKKGEFIKRPNKNGQEEVIQVTTDKDGNASITAIGAGTYYLMETKAPAGYELLGEPIEVTVANDGSMRIAHIVINNVKSKDTPTPTPTPTPKVTKPGKGTPEVTKPITGTPGVVKPTTGTPASGNNGRGILLPRGMSAKTGDTTKILGFILLAVASIGIVGYLVKRKKKQAQ